MSEAAPTTAATSATSSGRPARGDRARRLWSRPDLRVVAGIVGLVVATRLTLTAVAQLAWLGLVAGDPRQRSCVGSHAAYGVPHLLGLWGNWDTAWYLHLAQQDYPTAATGIPARSWAFFPLYPGLIRVLGFLLGGRYFLAGFVISNTALVVACYFLHQLITLECDHETAWRAVKYLLLLPVAFLFSAVLSEALFLALAIGAFYFARRRRWLVACLCVGLLGATRAGGVLVAVPLGLQYLAERRFDLRRIGWNVLSFALAPAGLLAFSAYAWARSGDPFVWQRVQFTVWGHSATNPLSTLWGGLTSGGRRFRYTAAYTLAWTSILVGATLLRRLRVGYLIYSLLLIGSTLTLGRHFWGSTMRYLVVVFPMAIVFARVTGRRPVDTALTIALALLQGGLLMLWTACQTLWVV